MPYPSLIKNPERMHPIARQQYSQINEAARRMGIDPQQFLEREKGLRAEEERKRKIAMDPNMSKSMSAKEKEDALNAYTVRKFNEFGIIG